MNTVTVRASKQYDILIGSGLLPTLGAEAKKLGKAQKICVVSETNVYPLYGAAVEESLKCAGFFRGFICIPRRGRKQKRAGFP